MNSAQSIRARLLSISRNRGVDFGLILVTYGIQRTLYRLSRVDTDSRLILKGAQLLQQLLPEFGYRPTRDADLTTLGDTGYESVADMFKAATLMDEDDGLDYQGQTLRIEPIRAQTVLGGYQVSVSAELAGARIPVRVDVSVSDAVVPDASALTFNTLLDMPAPRIKGYAVETVVAEKLHAIAALGLINTRLKDYFDLWMIQQHIKVRHQELVAAIEATFRQRNTQIGAPLLGLSDAFYGDEERSRMWDRTLKTIGAPSPGLPEVCKSITEAFGPALLEAQATEV